MRKREEESIDTPVASLIDVVFLLIIFFVVTAAVDKDIVDETITLAQAKHVAAVAKKPRNIVTVNVQKDGSVNIALQRMSLTTLEAILRARVAAQGNHVPVLIRADADTLFNDIDKVMNAIGKAGLFRIKLAAQSTK